MKHTDVLPQLSNGLPEQMTGPSSGAEYDRLSGQRPRDLAGHAPRVVGPTATDPPPTRSQGDHEPARESEPARDHDSSLYDSSLYDVILYGIAGVVVVMMLEQFVQMGVALQRPHYR
jgi:hypothetical protein